MKQVAVIIYEGYCLCEISTALEVLSMADVPITIFAEEKKTYRSEEGLLLVSEHTLEELVVDAYDALLLSGFDNDKPTILYNEQFMEIIRAFDRQKKVIAAISIAPILLLKAGILQDVSFMAGIRKADLLEEGFTMEDMQNMQDWDACCREGSPAFIRDGHILTAVIMGFREWAIEIGKLLDLEVYPKSFGLTN